MIESKKSIGFVEDLPCLRALLFIVEDTWVNALQFPGMEERRPVNEFAQRRPEESCPAPARR